MIDGLTINRIIRDNEFNMGQKHWHTECEIQYLLAGNRSVFIEDKTSFMNAGSLLIVDSKQIHRTTSNKEFYHDRILLLVEKEKFEKVAKTIGFDLNHFFAKHSGVIQIPISDRKYIEDILSNISREIMDKEEGFEIIVQTKILELWIYIKRLKKNGMKLCEVHTNTSEKYQVAYVVAEYIKKNYSEPISLDELANRFFVDKYYLSRMFKDATGFNINEFLNIERIQQAQRLLEDSTLSIENICKVVGYNNTTYFSKVFKKQIETTPLKYRKKQTAYKEGLREKNNQ